MGLQCSRAVEDHCVVAGEGQQGCESRKVRVGTEPYIPSTWLGATVELEQRVKLSAVLLSIRERS